MFGKMINISYGLIFLLLQSSPVTSYIQNLTICEKGAVTTSSVKLNMDTSAIAGTNGFCLCDVLFHEQSAFSMIFQNITSPNCSTKILFTDNHIVITCQSSYVEDILYTNNFSPNDLLVMKAEANGDSQVPMSGTIQMSSDNNKEFTLMCHKTKVIRRTTSTVTTATPLPTKQITSKTKSTTTGGTYITSTQSNETLTAVTSNEFQVALTVGCSAGGVVLVGLIVLAIVIYRRKKPQRKTTKNNDASSIQKGGDRRSIDDEYLSMENDLYCSSNDLPMSSENAGDHAGVEPEGKSKPVVSSNIYTLVDKPQKTSSPPKSNLNHRTAPSGDVYTVVEDLDELYVYVM